MDTRGSKPHRIAAEDRIGLKIAAALGSEQHSQLPHDLISLKAAGALIAVDKKTIRNWIDAGDLPGFQLNGHMWRVSRKTLLALARPSMTERQSDGVA